MGALARVGRSGGLFGRSARKKPRTIRGFLPSTSPVVRWTLTILGTVFVAIGVVGVFVPLLPTTPFLLLAAACFARGSRRMHSWLLSNRLLGRYLRNYLERRTMTRRDKVVSLLFLWVTLSMTALFVDVAWVVKGVLGLIGAGVTTHLLLLDPDEE